MDHNNFYCCAYIASFCPKKITCGVTFNAVVGMQHSPRLAYQPKLILQRLLAAIAAISAPHTINGLKTYLSL